MPCSLAWFGRAAVVPLVLSLGPAIVALLAAGGILYTVGVLFHLRERLPFRNVIRHAFVLVAAAFHYATVAGRVTGK